MSNIDVAVGIQELPLPYLVKIGTSPCNPAWFLLHQSALSGDQVLEAPRFERLV